MSKPRKMKKNSFTLETVKPRNEALHQARHQAKAGRQNDKVSFNRAREKQKTRLDF